MHKLLSLILSTIWFSYITFPLLLSFFLSSFFKSSEFPSAPSSVLLPDSQSQCTSIHDYGLCLTCESSLVQLHTSRHFLNPFTGISAYGTSQIKKKLIIQCNIHIFFKHCCDVALPVLKNIGNESISTLSFRILLNYVSISLPVRGSETQNLVTRK